MPSNRHDGIDWLAPFQLFSRAMNSHGVNHNDDWHADPDLRSVPGMIFWVDGD